MAEHERRREAGGGRETPPRKRATSDTVREMSMPEAMREAARQLAELLGRAPESVSAMQHAGDGWQADVEVLEVERIPDTSSVMASYRVRLDDRGRLVEYERRRRYPRSEIDRDGRG